MLVQDSWRSNFWLIKLISSWCDKTINDQCPAKGKLSVINLDRYMNLNKEEDVFKEIRYGNN